MCCSCGSAGRPGTGNTAVEQVKVKQEPGVEEECSYSGTNVKTERSKDGRRSACMVFYCFVSFHFSSFHLMENIWYYWHLSCILSYLDESLVVFLKCNSLWIKASEPNE